MARDKSGPCCAPSVGGSAGQFAMPNILASGTHAGHMIDLPGGWFRMGADDGPHPEDGEEPVREVFVDPFSLAETAVTVAQYRRFVQETGYKTLAEVVGSAFVFHLFADPDTDYPAPVQAPWWRLVSGACWHAPNGPECGDQPAEDHPVTHIALADAMAYCRWSGTRLPSEAEWEFAARGGLDGQPYPWGSDLELDGVHHCNVWQGNFPAENSGADGFVGTAPASSYAPNGYGFYNMTGNVWEWTSDRFTNLHSPRPARNPKGPMNGGQFVAKGGSYLCHVSYCARYRTSSRQGLPPDTTTGNLGFRVAKQG